MVVMFMTNAQMGIVCFERREIFGSNCSPSPSLSYGFSIPRRPIFGIAVNTGKAKQIRIVGVRMPNCGTINALPGEANDRFVNGGLLEKEFKFKPSFDEYLKAMESVRTGREKKQADNSSRYKSKNNLREKDALRTPSLEGDQEIGKVGDFERRSHQEKKSKFIEQDGLYGNSIGVASRKGLDRGKFDEKEKGSRELKDARKMDLRVGFREKGYQRSGRGMVQDELDGRERKMGEEMTNRRLMKYPAGRVEPKLEESRLGRNVKARWVQDQGGVSDAVKNNCGTVDLVGKLGLNKNSLKILERKMSFSSQRDRKLRGHAFETETHGLRSREMRGRLERNHVQGEKVTDYKISLKNGNFNKNSKAFLEKSDDNDLVERAAFKKFEEFTDVRDKPRVSRMEMEERIQKLAKCLNGADINMPEWMFSQMMRSAKIRFTDHSILRVIQILGKLRNWRRVLQVINWLQLRERFKSHKIRYIYTTALDVLGKARRPVEALNLFHAMQQQMSSYPDLVAYHCIAVTLGQAGHMKELFDVIDSMRSPPKKKFKTGVLEKWDPRMEPDIVVYNAVLNACVQRKQWEGAFWVLQQLKQQGQQPSSTTYGLVMEVMLTCGKHHLVHEFFKKVHKSSIPNALTYKVLVNTLWREGKTDEAILAVGDMERRGIVGSAGLYYDLARCLCSAGRFQEALMQIDKICKVANKPLVVTYTGLIQACLDSGNVQNGAYIFNHMHEFCSPNLVTCNIMLKAYLEHGMFEEAKELFLKMSEDGNCIGSKADYNERVIPDIYTFNTMLEACITEKRWDDFEYVYKRMLHHGCHFNAKRHLRMILDASRAGKGELLEATWKHLSQADQIPPPLLIKERFCMKLEKDDYATAFSCITSNPASELQAFSKKAWLNLFKENAHRFRKDTLVGLIHEGSILIARSDSPNLIFQNLITSCREFFRTYMTVAEINPQKLSTVQSETVLES